jgi:hypothetical protein
MIVTNAVERLITAPRGPSVKRMPGIASRGNRTTDDQTRHDQGG